DWPGRLRRDETARSDSSPVASAGRRGDRPRGANRTPPPSHEPFEFFLGRLSRAEAAAQQLGSADDSENDECLHGRDARPHCLDDAEVERDFIGSDGHRREVEDGSDGHDPLEDPQRPDRSSRERRPRGYVPDDRHAFGPCPGPRTVRMSTIFAIQTSVMPAAPRSATGTEIWVRPMSVAELCGRSSVDTASDSKSKGSLSLESTRPEIRSAAE